MTRRDVLFDENEQWKWTKEETEKDNVSPLSLEPEDGPVPNELSSSSENNNTPPSSPPASHASNTTFSSSSSPSVGQSPESTPPAKFRSLADIYASCQFALFCADPETYKEASTKEEWKKAMAEEMASITKNQTWQLVELP